MKVGPARRSVEIGIGIATVALGFAPMLMTLYRVVPVVIRVGPQVLLDPRVSGALPAVVVFPLLSYAGYRHIRMATLAPKLLEALVNSRAGVRPRDWPVAAEDILSAPSVFPFRLRYAFAQAVDTGQREIALDLLAQAPSQLRIEGALFYALVEGDPANARRCLALDRATLVRRLMRLLNPELARLSWAAVLLVEGDHIAGEKGLARWRRHFMFYRRSPEYVGHLWASDAMERRLAARTA